MPVDHLVFSSLPEVAIGGNTFINTPIILQYVDTPLIEVVRRLDASFEFHVPIFDVDGTKLAHVKGTQLYLTEEGKKVKGLRLIHPQERQSVNLAARLCSRLNEHRPRQ